MEDNFRMAGRKASYVSIKRKGNEERKGKIYMKDD